MMMSRRTSATLLPSCQQPPLLSPCPRAVPYNTTVCQCCSLPSTSARSTPSSSGSRPPRTIPSLSSRQSRSGPKSAHGLLYATVQHQQQQHHQQSCRGSLLQAHAKRGRPSSASPAEEGSPPVEDDMFEAPEDDDLAIDTEEGDDVSDCVGWSYVRRLA